MGTQLLQRGASLSRSFDELNLSAPEMVAEVHGDYVAAGAQLVLTNTFCANPIHLDRWGIADKAWAVNSAGVRLARKAASGTDVLVAGSVGPTGGRLAPQGALSSDAVGDSYEIQVGALLDAGVDLLWMETFSDLGEIDIAIEVARRLGDVPIIASVTFSRDGYTLTGETPELVARHLRDRGVDGIGVNCSTGPLAVSHVIDRYASVLDGDGPFVTAKPNAGFPEPRGGRLFYPATADYLAERGDSMRSAGCSIVGGCCGTTPAHIAALRKAFVQPPRPRARATSVGTVSERVEPAAPVAAPPSALATAFATERFVVTVEVEPPRSSDTAQLERDALLLRRSGATVLDISDMPMARLRMTGLAAASKVQGATGLETVLHFPVRGRNLLRVQGDLLAARALGVRNLFVTMGDSSAIGDYPQAFDHHDIIPTGLVRLIKERFNHGVDSSGASIGEPCGFTVGGAASLTPDDVDREIALVKRKVDAGCDFLLTQPVFDAAAALRFLDRYAARHGELSIPVLVGVLPLASVRHARFLSNEVPGMSVPDATIDAMDRAQESSRDVGIALAAHTAASLRDRVAGVYVIPAFRRYDLAARVIEALIS
jgi:methionine synthase / methylenetetrahydrofolate reductase(NADPH)